MPKKSIYASESRKLRASQILAVTPQPVGRQQVTSAKTRLALVRHERLNKRAEQLARQYVPEVVGMDYVLLYRPVTSVWGSCNRDRLLITIADVCRQMPRYIEDFVIIHELAHLIHANHGEDFQAIMARFPKNDKAVHNLKLEGISL